MVAPPPQGPSDWMYCRMRGPAVEADPARARPKPSRIVFLPSSTTCAGTSSYLVWTMNSETYLVRPGALANSSAGVAAAARALAALAAFAAPAGLSARPARASVDLQKSRRIKLRRSGSLRDIGGHLLSVL